MNYPSSVVKQSTVLISHALLSRQRIEFETQSYILKSDISKNFYLHIKLRSTIRITLANTHLYKNNNNNCNKMANINVHWFEEISERLNIDIDLDLKKDIVY